MIYINELKKRGMHFCGKAVESCHLISNESEEELIEFAIRIGLKKDYMRVDRKGRKYFPIVGRKRQQAIEIGAVEINDNPAANCHRKSNEGVECENCGHIKHGECQEGVEWLKYLEEKEDE